MGAWGLCAGTLRVPLSVCPGDGHPTGKETPQGERWGPGALGHQTPDSAAERRGWGQARPGSPPGAGDPQEDPQEDSQKDPRQAAAGQAAVRWGAWQPGIPFPPPRGKG